MDTKLQKRIEDALDTLVRPKLAEHQGGVVLLGFEDGVLRTRLTGRCSGCPSASLTTESLIAQQLRDAIPEIRDVVLVSGVSESLLEQARSMMGKRNRA